MRILRTLIPLLLALAPAALPATASAQIAIGVAVNITIEPPALPDYDQPPIPEPGYIWTPGYWAYGDDGYYWVPGTWVEPPEVGVLWTPGYWGWNDGVYVFHDGYWGPHIGFYGGINYGFGYGGVGYEGCHWEHGALAYNTTVNNFGGVHITNVYSKTVIVNNVTVNKVSFNGGNGGTTAQPTAGERVAEHDHHFAATATQMHHVDAARSNRSLLASVNHGRPAIAATGKPGEFSGHGVVGAHATRDVKGGAQGGTPPGHDHDQGQAHEASRGTQPHDDHGHQDHADHAGPAHQDRAVAPQHQQQPHPQAKLAPPPHPQAPHPPAPHPAARPHPAPHPAAHAAPPKKGKHG